MGHEYVLRDSRINGVRFNSYTDITSDCYTDSDANSDEYANPNCNSDRHVDADSKLNLDNHSDEYATPTATATRHTPTTPTRRYADCQRRHQPTGTPAVSTGLVLALGLNENSGTTVADASGQNNTGTAFQYDLDGRELWPRL